LLGTLFDARYLTNQTGPCCRHSSIPLDLTLGAQKLLVPEHHFWRGLLALGVDL
jgi:hypothetical protein